MKRIEKPRPGDEILPKVLELVDACNRRVEGPNVIDVPQGWYVKPDVFIPPTPEMRRGRLMEDLYGCDSAQAVEIIIDPDGNESTGDTFTVNDPLNKVSGEPLAIPDANNDLFLPAGTCFDSHYRSDADQYEFDTTGLCNCASGSESSSGSGSGECIPGNPYHTPDGNCAGWHQFNDCDGNPHWYWGI